MHDMEPPLLVRAWMMAHLWGARYQALVCCGGSSGETAFRESLRAQYTSSRHDARVLHTYYITGTHGDDNISRITSTRVGEKVGGITQGPLRITIASNTRAWQDGELSDNGHLTDVNLKMERLVEFPTWFFPGCYNFEYFNLESLHTIEAIPSGFFFGCSSLKKVARSPT